MVILANAYIKMEQQKKSPEWLAEQHVAPMLKTMVVGSMGEIQLKQYWFDTTANTGYSLASLALDDFIHRLAQKKDEYPAMFEFVKDRAEQVFLEMAAERVKKD